MSVTNGVIQFLKREQQPVVIAFTVTPDGYAFCGQTVTFNLTLISNLANVASQQLTAAGTTVLNEEESVQGTFLLGSPVISATGTCSVVDANTEQYLESGTVIEGVCTINITNYFGDRTLYIYYRNDSSSIYKNTKTPTFNYYMLKSSSRIALEASHTPDHTIDNIYTFYAAVTSIYASPTGVPVDFRLYTDNLNFTTLTGATVDEFSAINVTIPANTMTAGKTYYLTAYFHGSGCIDPCTNGFGTSGFVLNPT